MMRYVVLPVYDATDPFANPKHAVFMFEHDGHRPTLLMIGKSRNTEVEAHEEANDFFREIPYNHRL